MEFAIDDTLPIFAGGLGILTADILFEASLQQKPLIGIGLFYHQADQVSLKAVTDKSGNILIISVPFADKQVKVKVWKKLVGNIPLYLLDTHVEGNTSEDYRICSQLYDGNKERRFKQEIILGIGGTKLLKSLNISPRYYHLNEAHCALAIIQATIQAKKANSSISFYDALNQTKNKTLFTNHTIVPTDNDVFSENLASIYLKPYAEDLQIPVHELIELGKVEDASMFSLTLLALRHSVRINAVSQLHSQIANKTWPGFNFIPITNGIFLPRWLQSPLAKVWPLAQKEPCSKKIFWQAHLKQKRAMLKLVNQRTGAKLEENALTITWARRITSYKRPNAIFKDIKRFEAILSTSNKPVQFLMAGKVHPNDNEAKQLVKHIHQLCRKDVCQRHFQFIPNYDITIAQALVGGSDIWLNTPLRGYEACGTSGMKACLNGVLQMTTKDGWTNDINWAKYGWTLDSDNVSEDIYRLLENEVTNLYFKQNSLGFSPEWVDRMIHSSSLIRKNYSSTRMFNHYIEKLYLWL